MKERILILGCGPAAVMAAVELKALDFDVEVVGNIRTYAVVEGISERVHDALKHRGLAGGIPAPVPRLAEWNGERHSANTERLIYRPTFDETMAGYLTDREIPVSLTYIDEIDRSAIRATGRDGRSWQGDFMIDARGRAAGFEGRGRVRGPETVSLGCCWQGEPGSPLTCAASQPDGWLWMARLMDGRVFVQVNRDSGEFDTGKEGIPDLIMDSMAELQLPVSVEGDPVEPGHARSSTPILVTDIVEDGYIRVGDAAAAVDPLSGNGIFHSLSSALTAVPVINTILRRSQDSERAMQFYRDRVEHLFYRFARTGRDFYRSETRWLDHPFWAPRRHWPDDEPLHLEQDEVIGQELRPVINNGFIDEHEVVITRDQPMGIWQVAKAVD